MAVDNSEVIDFIGIDTGTNNVILTISDHLEWDKGNDHLFVLQAKINYYIAVVDSGALVENYPDFKGRCVVISIALKYLPDKEGMIFLEKARELLVNSGYGFQYEKLNWEGSM